MQVLGRQPSTLPARPFAYREQWLWALRPWLCLQLVTSDRTSRVCQLSLRVK